MTKILKEELNILDKNKEGIKDKELKNIADDYISLYKFAPKAK
ncbi:hypothetical protein [Romboutsia maritimum]|nr:hypothetical protein [Romboutsia maritimum]